MSESAAPEPGRYKVTEFASVPVARPSIAEAIGAGMPPPAPRRYGRWFLALALGFLAAALGYDAASFVLTLFAISPALGTAGAALLAAALVVGIVWIADELRRYRALASAERLRAAAARLRGSASYGEGVKLVKEMAPALSRNAVAREGLVRFEAILRGGHTDADVLSLFAREVLDPLDRQAVERVAGAARATALGVAASPVGLLDAVIGIYRGLRMLREIATIYGLRPGTFGSWRLFKRIVLDGAGFAAADLVGDVWSELMSAVGGRATGIVSAKLGEGIYAAQRMTRLGVAAMQSCRPIPFADPGRAMALQREAATKLMRSLLPGGRTAGAEGVTTS
jgi:putative membrane protein